MRRWCSKSRQSVGVLDSETSGEGEREGIHEVVDTSPSRGWDIARRHEAEQWAADILSTNETINLEHLSIVMRAWAGRRNYERKRVTPDGHDFVRSDTFGLIRQHTGQLGVSTISNEFPSACTLLNEFAHHNAIDTTRWTSITVNTHFASRRHRDCNNLGPSYMVAVGDFSGCELHFLALR